jgi:amino acid transporter
MSIVSSILALLSAGILSFFMVFTIAALLLLAFWLIIRNEPKKDSAGERENRWYADPP